MVDLVKIRKKAKKKAEEDAAQKPPEVQEDPAAVDAFDSGAAGFSPPAASPDDQSRGAEAHRSTEAAPPVVVAQPSKEEIPTTSKLERFKEQAGRLRAAEVHVATDEEVSDANALELLTFVVASEQYAVEIERIVEIVPPRVLTRIPNADGSILGIISLRGTIVTLVDVRRKLRHPPSDEVTPDTHMVVVDFRNEIVGFIVDRVVRVVKLAPEAVEPPPTVHVEELDESVRGVFRIGDALTILLDLDKLLDSRALAATSA